MSRDCCVALPRGAMDLSVICDCGISGSYSLTIQGAQRLSGRVLDSKPRGRGFKPRRGYCVVVLEQDTFILA